MNERGFTIAEVVVALAILSFAMVGLLGAFQTFMDTNTFTEERSDAVAAAQMVMEILREPDPGSLPSSGSSAMQYVDVGQHQFGVVVHYCTSPQYCDADSRHILLEVSHGGEVIYTVESVYTRLR